MTKNTVLSVILGVVTLLILFQITPPYVASNLKVTVSKNGAEIKSVHQERDVTATKNLMLDVVNLEVNNKLQHPKLGAFAYAEQYFMDIEAVMRVEKSGRYGFLIGSDDGFAFYIDGGQICDFTGDRPMTYDRCQAVLNEGEHSIRLSYFQGFGNSGLRASYSVPGDNETYFIGEDSDYVSFSPN